MPHKCGIENWRCVRVTGLALWRFAGEISIHHADCCNWGCLWFTSILRVCQVVMWPGIQTHITGCRLSVLSVTEGITFASEYFNNMEREVAAFLRRHGLLHLHYTWPMGWSQIPAFPVSGRRFIEYNGTGLLQSPLRTGWQNRWQWCDNGGLYYCCPSY